MALPQTFMSQNKIYMKRVNNTSEQKQELTTKDEKGLVRKFGNSVLIELDRHWSESRYGSWSMPGTSNSRHAHWLSLLTTRIIRKWSSELTANQILLFRHRETQREGSKTEFNPQRTENPSQYILQSTTFHRPFTGLLNRYPYTQSKPSKSPFL